MRSPRRARASRPRARRTRCANRAGDDPHRHVSVDARRHVQRHRPSGRRRGALGRDAARPRRVPHRDLRQGALRDRRSRSCRPARSSRSRARRASTDEWNGPYFGFEHVELTLFGHNLRIADLMGQWNWCFGPPPFGLHYARYLFRDGAERGYERLAADAARSRGRGVGPPPDVAQRAARGGPPRPRGSPIARCEWLRDVDGPFFGWVSFTDPHHPMDPPAPWCDRYAPEDVLEVLPEVHPDEFEASRRSTRSSRRACAAGRWSGRTRAARRSRARTSR